ncbi:hypothetical protein VA599_22965 [Chromobacterium sp. TRC.1.1.SA]|uniref:ABC transporter ATP-binding protein n=1 Tax=Chromobacterium indicum TaxID=3110228 RepID=A0ABV0CR10_9NEIS
MPYLTSALAPHNQRHCHQRLRSELPDCAVISVSHRPEVDAYHDRAWRIDG